MLKLGLSLPNILKSAKWQFQGRIYTSVCYTCQQVAEKALKALILANGKVIPKIHSLDRLASEIKKIGVNISEIEKNAQELDKYYISTRYPGQYGGPEGMYDETDARQAISAAERILSVIKAKISK